MAGGTLVFYRTLRWQDAVRTYTIRVDGRDIGTLKPRSTLPVSIDAGRHTCRAMISWTGSGDVEVDVQEGRTTRVHVLPGRGSAWRRVETSDEWLQLIIEPE